MVAKRLPYCIRKHENGIEIIIPGEIAIIFQANQGERRKKFIFFFATTSFEKIKLKVFACFINDRACWLRIIFCGIWFNDFPNPFELPCSFLAIKACWCCLIPDKYIETNVFLIALQYHNPVIPSQQNPSGNEYLLLSCTSLNFAFSCRCTSFDHSKTNNFTIKYQLQAKFSVCAKHHSYDKVGRSKPYFLINHARKTSERLVSDKGV